MAQLEREFLIQLIYRRRTANDEVLTTGMMSGKDGVIPAAEVAMDCTG